MPCCTVCAQQGAEKRGGLPGSVLNTYAKTYLHTYAPATAFAATFYRPNQRTVFYAFLENGEQVVLLMAPRIDEPWTVNVRPPKSMQYGGAAGKGLQWEEAKEIASDVTRKAGAGLHTVARGASPSEWRQEWHRQREETRERIHYKVKELPLFFLENVAFEQNKRVPTALFLRSEIRPQNEQERAFAQRLENSVLRTGRERPDMLEYSKALLREAPLYAVPPAVVVDDLTWRLLQERLPPPLTEEGL
eukprot:3940617-Rhodomonas_salina.2